MSQYIGDLENPETRQVYHETILHFRRLFAAQPEAVAYDVDTAGPASRYALESDIPRKIGIQHHHAHIASVLAEHGLVGPVIGISGCDEDTRSNPTQWTCEVGIFDLLETKQVVRFHQFQWRDRNAHEDGMAALGGECHRLRSVHGLDVVAVSGALFGDATLLERLVAHLQSDAFQVFINRQVPPGDGGLSVGQCRSGGCCVGTTARRHGAARHPLSCGDFQDLRDRR